MKIELPPCNLYHNVEAEKHVPVLGNSQGNQKQETTNKITKNRYNMHIEKFDKKSLTFYRQ